MVGFLIFYDIWRNLGENCRNRILGNIFGFGDVSVSSVSIKYKSIIFRMFRGNVFYQLAFILGDGENKIRNSERVVEKLIFMGNGESREGDEENYEFIYRLMRCRDEKEVYLLVRKFL